MKHVTIEYAVTENRRVELDLTDSFDASNYEKDALLEEIYRKEDLGNYNCLDYQAYSISGIYFDTPSASVDHGMTHSSKKGLILFLRMTVL